MFQSKSALVHCYPASRKRTPQSTLNKKSEDCLVVLYQVKNEATRHI